jgi:hypothetical protein
LQKQEKCFGELKQNRYMIAKTITQTFAITTNRAKILMYTESEDDY